MVKDENILAEEGIRFFGQISASATHEIKNTLAIINENAGLLEDLSIMSHNDDSLSPARVNDISQRLIRQVQRTDIILKRLNRFSHSVDSTTKIVDLEETIHFVIELTARLVEQQEAIVEVISPIAPITIDTNLFYLENVIWRAIEEICFAAKGEKKIIISFGNDVTKPSIWFSMSSGIDNLKNNSMDEFLRSKGDATLLAYLDVSIEKNNENNSFGIVWPKLI